VTGTSRRDTDRLASTRAQRAAAAREIRSAGTASSVPKYISSGVCFETPNVEAPGCVRGRQNATSRRIVATRRGRQNPHVFPESERHADAVVDGSARPATWKPPLPRPRRDEFWSSRAGAEERRRRELLPAPRQWRCRSCSDPAPLEFLRSTCLICGVCILEAC
jgi:hypothetical protein